MLPAKWLVSAFNSEAERQEYRRLHLLGHVPEDLAEFGEFYSARRLELRDEIRALLV